MQLGHTGRFARLVRRGERAWCAVFAGSIGFENRSTPRRTAEYRGRDNLMNERVLTNGCPTSRAARMRAAPPRWLRILLPLVVFLALLPATALRGSSDLRRLGGRPDLDSRNRRPRTGHKSRRSISERAQERWDRRFDDRS